MTNLTKETRKSLNSFENYQLPDQHEDMTNFLAAKNIFPTFSRSQRATDENVIQKKWHKRNECKGLE